MTEKRKPDELEHTAKKQKVSSDQEGTLEQPESDTTFKDLTCSICWEPHTNDNLLCRNCGQCWHRECLAKVVSCPVCRSDLGFVKPRPYDELIKIITTKLVRCNFCNLAVQPEEYPQVHLSTCEKYKTHLLRRVHQQRKVLYKSMELDIPQDPIEIKPEDHLNMVITIQIPDLQAAKRIIQLDLQLSKLPLLKHFRLEISSTLGEHLPLNLSILAIDSVQAQPYFITIPDKRTKLQLELVLKTNSAARLWVTAL
jgi:hypothetical protein